MARLAWCLVAVATFATDVRAEQRWKYDEEIDEINNTKVRTVVVVGEDAKSAMVLRAEEGKKPTLTLVPGVVMFPDKTDVQSKQMGVQITMRATAMEEPFTGMWRMAWMDYKAASLPCKRDSVVNKVFAGDSITFQLDKTGKRFKFATKGEGFEGLQDAVAKAVEIAAPDKLAGDTPKNGK